MRFLPKGLRATAIAACLGLTACGGGGSAIPLPQGPSIQSSKSSLVLDEGTTGQVELTLSEEPAGSVTVTASIVGGFDSFTINGSTSFVFDATNWDQPQSISISTTTDPDGMNNWGRLQLLLDGGMDIRSVDLTQQDDDGGTVVTNGVALRVKDGAGVGAIDHPVTAVIPLEYGKHQNTSGFRIVDPTGSAIPVQFKVLNRWWARDNSIRHVVAHFKATVPPNDTAIYTFQESGGSPAATNAVSDMA